MTLPTIIPRSEHCISRSDIHEHALKVLYRLHNSGFQAYLVGGCVRDLLLGLQPKDFDVATDAEPEQVRGLFNNCRLIGRRFRLAHVHFGRDVIEVATFRGSASDNHPDRVVESSGLIARDNIYGSIEEDVWRRDFTANALYYNIADFSIVDYVNGLDDIQRGELKLIGDVQLRYQEDPVRLIRAVRFAAKLGFSIEADSERVLSSSHAMLADVSAARLFEEVLKLFHSGHALKCYQLLRHYGLFKGLFPETEKNLQGEQGEIANQFLESALRNTDARISENKSVNPAYLFACLLWYPVRSETGVGIEEGAPPIYATNQVASRVLGRQSRITSIPRRLAHIMREVWTYQSRLECAGGRRALSLLGQRCFRAAYDFLCLRSECGEEVYQRSEWWTLMQTLSEDEQKEKAEAMPNRYSRAAGAKKSRSRKRNYKRSKR